MRREILLVLALLLTPAAGVSAAAEEVGGAEWPLQVEAADGTELALNGAALRTRYLVRVYSGALYLAEPTDDPAAVVASEEHARMAIHFLRDGIGEDDINDAWRDGIAANHDADTVAALEPALKELLALTPDELNDGDVLAYDHLPGEGLVVQRNGEERGRVADEQLFNAMVTTWVGDEPPSADFRDGVLGR